MAKAAKAEKEAAALVPDLTLAAQVPAQQLFTMDEVKRMMEEVVSRVRTEKGEGFKKPEVRAKHAARVSRLESKFIVDFKNVNTDPYLNKKVYAFNQFDEKERQWVAWITVIFQDGSEKTVPLKYLCEMAVGVKCDIMKKEDIDTSYSIGQVEKVIIKGYKPEGTGMLVDQTVMQKQTMYTIKTPRTEEFPEGELLTLPEYVLNIGGAPEIMR